MNLKAQNGSNHSIFWKMVFYKQVLELRIGVFKVPSSTFINPSQPLGGDKKHTVKLLKVRNTLQIKMLHIGQTYPQLEIEGNDVPYVMLLRL